MVSGVFSIPLDAHGAKLNRPLPDGGKAAIPLREFIAGDENSLVHAAAGAFFDPETEYNPLVLVGKTGTGKTRLARGLLARWRVQFPTRQAVTITGADFARAYATAIDTNSVNDFRGRFHNAALLLFDNLSELAGKAGAQHEFANTIDVLLDRQILIVVTSRLLPADMESLDAALVSRLTAGLIVPLSAPGPAARREILRQLSHVRGLQLTDKCLQQLADELHGTVPQLNRYVHQLQAAGDQAAEFTDEQLVRQFIVEQEESRCPSMRTITQQVARYFNLPVAHLRGPSRRTPIAHARGIAIHLIRKLTGNSLQQIGHYLGGRDHTTILHAARKTVKLLESDFTSRHAAMEIERRLNLT